MKELKPFDLEAAKRGDPVMWTDGARPHFVGVSSDGLICLEHEGRISTYAPCRVFMAPKKRTVWVNIHSIEGVAAWYDSKNKAESMHVFGVSQGNSQAIAIAVPVEIEE